MTTPPTTQPRPAPLPERVQAALAATEGHTAGPWYGEDAPRTWQLFARRVEPWPDGTPIDLRDDSPEGMELHPLQILKAPKKGTPFAEYWPEPADAALIAAAPDLRALLAETAAALAAAEAREAGLRAALERVEGEATVFEVCYRGALRGMDGWHGPLDPEDGTSVGIMPAITAALGGQS
ncbi:hypothetical protein ACMT4L_16790 [Deinococcus sp. A31D244]|uniref:hypothetical protein n=1 Tax=Deinococcus sp. A31D244 TaxID=3397675 RepID=UPI0039E1CFCF